MQFSLMEEQPIQQNLFNIKVKKVSKPFTDACFTCKKRRVQCDMTKPFCNTCKSKKNLVCEGFDVKLRWSDPIEFDIYGEISANPKHSKILDSDNKDPQYQRRKIKFLHYKEEYEYYDEMDDELTALNKVLSQHKNKIMNGETWIIKKFGVFEGISFSKILHQRRLKKQKLRMLKKKQQLMEKEDRHRASGKALPLKHRRNKRKAVSRSIQKKEKDVITGRFEDDIFVYDDNITRLPRNLRQKQNTNITTTTTINNNNNNNPTDPMLIDNDSRFFTDFFEHLHSPFTSQNPGLSKKVFIPETPVALTNSVNTNNNNNSNSIIQKDGMRQGNRNNNNNNNNVEWNALPSYLEDIFKNHQAAFDIDSSSNNNTELSHELLGSKESLATNSALSLVTNNNEKTDHINLEHGDGIAVYYKQPHVNIESLTDNHLHRKDDLQVITDDKNDIRNNGIHNNNHNNHSEGYNFLNEPLTHENSTSNIAGNKNNSISLSPNENKLLFEIKDLEKRKHILKQEVDNLLSLKEKLIKELSDLGN